MNRSHLVRVTICSVFVAGLSVAGLFTPSGAYDGGVAPATVTTTTTMLSPEGEPAAVSAECDESCLAEAAAAANFGLQRPGLAPRIRR